VRLFLAERGRGTTSPNRWSAPWVVSASGVIVGQGAHIRPGGAHAEVAALDMAGQRAEGATLYWHAGTLCARRAHRPLRRAHRRPAAFRVWLRPWSIPIRACPAGALITCGERGIGVTVGVGEAASRELNGAFVTWVTKRRSVCDCEISSFGRRFRRRSRPSGRLLTGDEANRYFHRQRAELMRSLWAPARC
jgi:diaminohydroxyphosphoribosylaminopyrimidine deaminase/5-amino-6-(5-phosphoribosylamino)uracil reductase